MKYNRLSFIEFTEPKIRSNGIKRTFAMFECECGNIHKYDYSSVKMGHTKQCFKCARKSASIKTRTHNNTNHPLYRKWQDMKNRCYNPNVDRYNSYGEFGITVCNEWKNSFESFYNWCILNNWNKNLQIDRIDVFKNYCPENCRLITAFEQKFNMKKTFYVYIENRKVSLSRLMHFNGMSKRMRTVYVGIKKNNKTIEYYLEKYNINPELEKNAPII